MKKKAFRIAVVCALGLCILVALVGPGEETRRQRIEKQFSAINGEHINLTKAIKATLADPGKYKTVETTYSDRGNEISVSQIYISNGARYVVEATVDTLGNVLSIKPGN
jgi:ribosome-associated translation inhibitor RaiA